VNLNPVIQLVSEPNFFSQVFFFTAIDTRRLDPFFATSGFNIKSETDADVEGPVTRNEQFVDENRYLKDEKYDEDEVKVRLFLTLIYNINRFLKFF
jgi:hypothetical protein